MKFLEKNSRLISKVLIFLCLFFVSFSALAAVKSIQQLNQAVQALQANANGRVNISRASKSPYISFLRANPKSPVVDISVSRLPEVRARNFLRNQKAAFVDTNMPLDLVTTQVSSASGQSIVRMQQIYNGVYVRGGEVVVQMNNAGITVVNSKLISNLAGLDITPEVNAQDALIAARNIILDRYGVAGVNFSAPKLEIFNEGALTGRPGLSRLAWFVEATDTMIDEYIWVDAKTGKLIRNFSQIARLHAKDRATFDAMNACTLDNLIDPVLADGGQTSGLPADIDATLAHNNAGIAYDYYLNNFNRDGLEPNRTEPPAVITIQSIVNLCDTFSAFVQPLGLTLELAAWNGSQMLYATGYAVDDIVGHEYTHAVIKYTANFNLVGESGALAESFADIIGETIDLDNAGNDAGDIAWDIGEDSPVIGAFRNLKNPGLNVPPSPATVTDASFYCGTDDDVFIHTNSAVLSHAFALLVDGTDFNGVTITPVALDKASRIFYEGLLLLTANSQFSDAFNALRAAADALATATIPVITTAENLSLHNALDAVELNVPSPCADKQIAYCPTGQAPQFIFSDDFENPGSGNWVSVVGIGGVDHWDWNRLVMSSGIYSTFEPRQGNYSLYGNTSLNGEQGGSSVEMANVITLPASGDIRTQFEHNFQFDTNTTHGGVIEYKVGGGFWLDASSLITQGGYTGTVTPGSLGPLQGDEAFVNYQFADTTINPPFGMPLPTYGSTQLDLSSPALDLAGQGIQFRFRVGIDNFSNERGWLIDDFAIYTCETQVFVLSSTASLTTFEAPTGSIANFDISLATQPQGSVVVNLVSSDASEGTVSPASITFTESNWGPQTVTISGVDDTVEDGDVLYNVTVSVGSSPAGSIYESVSPLIISVTNTDDDIIAAVPPGSSGGGGCSLSTRAQFDPVLPFLLLLSIVYLLGRKRLAVSVY